MALVKQFAVTAVVVLLAGALWLRLDEAPGRYLLAEGSPLPGTLRPLVATLSTADDTPPVGATPQRGDEGPVQLVAVDPAHPDVTRDRLRAVGTGEAQRSVPVYPDATGIVTQVNFGPGQDVAEGDVLARLQSATEALAVDRARIALQAAEEQVERYRALSSSSITAVQLQEVERVLDTARLDLRAAEIALDERVIVAPIDGRVGLSPIEVGALVGGQTLIATIDDRARLKVVFNVPEGFVPQLSVGHDVAATPTTRTGRVYDGAISALDSRIDEASRTLRAEAMIDNEADELRPGMSFSVEMGFPGQEFLSVDPLAIQWERAGSYVWVVTDETVSKAPVRIIERNIDRILVASDTLRDGDPVVTEGVAQLREGVRVRLQTLLPVPDLPDEPTNAVPSADAAPEAPGRVTGDASGAGAGERPGPSRSRIAAQAGERPDALR